MAASSGSKRLLRLALGVALLGAVVLLGRRFTLPGCAEIQAYLETWGAAAPVLFVLAYAVATVAFIPGLVITLLAGLAFGPWFGTLLVVLGSNLGAVLAFVFARFFARETVERLLSQKPWFIKFKASMTSSGFNFVLFVRLVPLFPFNGLNYACGLVPLKLRDYMLGTAIGMLPGTFAYVYLGAAGCKLIDAALQGNFHFADLPDDVKTRLLIAIVLLAALAVLPLAFKRRQKAGSPAP